MRLPPFSFYPSNGHSFLHIKTDITSTEAIMHLTDKNIWIVPLEGGRIQIILVPITSVAANLKNSSMCEQVKSLMKDIDESKIKKHSELFVPSFKVGLES